MQVGLLLEGDGFGGAATWEVQPNAATKPPIVENVRPLREPPSPFCGKMIMPSMAYTRTCQALLIASVVEAALEGSGGLGCAAAQYPHSCPPCCWWILQPGAWHRGLQGMQLKGTAVRH
jgi:hypothetical protein